MARRKPEHHSRIAEDVIADVVERDPEWVRLSPLVILARVAEKNGEDPEDVGRAATWLRAVFPPAVSLVDGAERYYVDRRTRKDQEAAEKVEAYVAAWTARAEAAAVAVEVYAQPWHLRDLQQAIAALDFDPDTPPPQLAPYLKRLFDPERQMRRPDLRWWREISGSQDSAFSFDMDTVQESTAQLSLWPPIRGV